MQDRVFRGSHNLKGSRIEGSKSWVLLSLFLFIAFSFNGFVLAQEPFYKEKTIRIVVGFSAGGGFDAYSRAIARHWGKHIPGNPTIIVENMTGAGSLIAANHVYNGAKPDGLTIGHFIGGLFLGQVLGAERDRVRCSQI